jgi:hypothetical protein
MHELTTTLSQLHDEYAENVNLAVAEGRDDLVAALSAEFAATATIARRGGALPAERR